MPAPRGRMARPSAERHAREVAVTRGDAPSRYRKLSLNVSVPPGDSVCVGATVTLWSV